MAKEKKLTAEEFIDLVESLSFEDKAKLHEALTSSIEAESNRRITQGAEAQKILEKINGKKP